MPRGYYRKRGERGKKSHQDSKQKLLLPTISQQSPGHFALHTRISHKPVSRNNAGSFIYFPLSLHPWLTASECIPSPKFEIIAQE